MPKHVSILISLLYNIAAFPPSLAHTILSVSLSPSPPLTRIHVGLAWLGLNWYDIVTDSAVAEKKALQHPRPYPKQQLKHAQRLCLHIAPCNTPSHTEKKTPRLPPPGKKRQPPLLRETHTDKGKKEREREKKKASSREQEEERKSGC